MRAHGGGGSIISTSSIAGLRGPLAPAAYTASKFGIVGLTQLAAAELAMSGIRVNCVAPTAVDTVRRRRFYRVADTRRHHVDSRRGASALNFRVG
jgi:NAD(P)-dependent dehydrogenase (short-subunit alcohol dehydrogenase family)